MEKTNKNSQDSSFRSGEDFSKRVEKFQKIGI